MKTSINIDSTSQRRIYIIERQIYISIIKISFPSQHTNQLISHSDEKAPKKLIDHLTNTTTRTAPLSHPKSDARNAISHNRRQTNTKTHDRSSPENVTAINGPHGNKTHT